MKIVIESTPQKVLIEGVSCRRWRGLTDGGHPCDVYTRLITLPTLITIPATEADDGASLDHLPKVPRIDGNLRPGVEAQPPVATGLM